MSLGIALIRMSPELKKIQGDSPSGIYSAEDFLKRIKSKLGEKIFFHVHSGEGGSVGPITGPYIFISSKKYKCPYGTQLNGSPQIVFKKTSYGEKNTTFLQDFFWGAKACFFDKESADKYLKDLHSNRDSLVKMF